MSKLPWAKYYFGIFLAAILSIIVAKFLTTNLFILFALSVSVFWVSVKTLANVNGYR